MLWPKIEHETCGEHLAASGAVGRNAMDEESVALALIATLQRRYPAELARRYNLADVQAEDFVVEKPSVAQARRSAQRRPAWTYKKPLEILLTDFARR